MATLYSAFFPPDDLSPDSEEWDVRRAYVDLTSREFSWLDRSDPLAPHLMPLEVVFDAIKLSRFLRKLPDAMTAEMEVAEQIAKAFREYKIPVIPIVGDDLDIATRTFERINSQGTPMSGKHMVHALTWSKTFDLQATIEDLRAEHLEPVGWAEIDEERILDVCRLALDLHMFDRDVDELSKRLRERPDIIERAVRAIRRAAEFFAAECHVVTFDLVPYKEQLVLIADALREGDPPKKSRLEDLHMWLWLTTYTELFSGSPYRRVREAVPDLRLLVRNGIWRWPADRGFERRKLPPGVDFRTPRGKALAARLAEIAQKDPVDERPFELLARRGAAAIRRMYYHVEPRLRGSPGNLFLVEEERVASLRQALETLPAGPTLQALCNAHRVSKTALEHLKAGRFAQLIAQRRQDLDAWEDAFVSHLADRATSRAT